MCRYGLKIYKQHYACFDCHKAFKYEYQPKETHEIEGRTQIRLLDRVCPECGGPLHPMGLDFKAPPKNNHQQWKKVAILYENGIAFHSCGCGSGPRPKRLNEVPAYLKGSCSHHKRPTPAR